MTTTTCGISVPEQKISRSVWRRSQENTGGLARPLLQQLVICCMSRLIVCPDNTIVSVALPTMDRDFGASAPGLQWIVASCTTLLASLLILASSIADRIERWGVFRSGSRCLRWGCPSTRSGLVWFGLAARVPDLGDRGFGTIRHAACPQGWWMTVGCAVAVLPRTLMSASHAPSHTAPSPDRLARVPRLEIALEGSW